MEHITLYRAVHHNSIDGLINPKPFSPLRLHKYSRYHVQTSHETGYVYGETNKDDVFGNWRSLGNHSHLVQVIVKKCFTSGYRTGYSSDIYILRNQAQANNTHDDIKFLPEDLISYKLIKKLPAWRYFKNKDIFKDSLIVTFEEWKNYAEQEYILNLNSRIENEIT